MPTEPMNEFDVCASIHTALRKACDSNPTTAAYSLICVFGSIDLSGGKVSPWLMYGQIVREKIENSGFHEIAMFEASQEFVHRWQEQYRDEHGRFTYPQAGMSMAYALQSVFRLFDQEDWENASSFLS